MQLKERTNCHQGCLNLTLKFSALQKWSTISAIIHPSYLDEKTYYLPLKKAKIEQKSRKRKERKWVYWNKRKAWVQQTTRQCVKGSSNRQTAHLVQSPWTAGGGGILGGISLCACPALRGLHCRMLLETRHWKWPSDPRRCSSSSYIQPSCRLTA